MTKVPLALLFVFCAAACASSPDVVLLARYGTGARPSGFDICKNYGCRSRARISFDAAEWGRVQRIFAPPPNSPAAERERIRNAIALMEEITGPKAGTSGDKAGAAILALDTDGQLDCIDEAYNTTIYLRLMAADGLLRWHEVGEPAQRGHVIDRWFHNTATIIERGSNAAYTVDSWFHANGEAPEIVRLSDWLKGWAPQIIYTNPHRS